MAALEIVGAHEAAAILGISPPTFSHLRARAKQKGEDTQFPVPYIELKCGPIWTAKSIRDFAKVYKPVVRAKPGQAKATKGEANVVDITEAKSVKAKKTAAKAPAKPKIAAKKVAPSKPVAAKKVVSGIKLPGKKPSAK